MTPSNFYTFHLKQPNLISYFNLIHHAHSFIRRPRRPNRSDAAQALHLASHGNAVSKRAGNCFLCDPSAFCTDVPIAAGADVASKTNEGQGPCTGRNPCQMW